MDEFLRRLRYYFRRRQFEAELDEEMLHHAALSGRKQFGNVTLLKEDSRTMWTWTFWEQLGQDLRYAVRTMIHNKTFTALATLSLALGIGANTAIYSFMDSILLRSLPVQDPESLVMLNWRSQPRTPGGPGKAGKQGKLASVMHGTMNSSGASYNDPRTGYNGAIFPYAALELFQKNDAVFSSVFAYYTSIDSLNLSIKGQADQARGGYVSGDYFRGLGVLPAAGRLINTDDDRAGAPPVMVVSYGFSQRRFGGATNAVGESVLINNIPFTVIGTAPPAFFGVDANVSPDFYVPLHANLLLETGAFAAAGRYADQNFYWIEIMARLRPGISIGQAQAAVAPAFQQWVSSTAVSDLERVDLPKLAIKEGAGGLDVLRRQYSKPLYVLLTLTGLILAIACANIANLLLARAAARRREMAVRLSMGAGRWRVMRQLLTESVLLASLGGALGVVFAKSGILFLTALLANGRENFTLHAELNWHVLGVTIALSLLTGMLFGLAPALQSTRVDVIPALKETRAGQPRAHHSLGGLSLSQVLVVSQVAISLVLLVAAGLFVRTLSNLQSIETGFNRENLLLFQLNARQAGHQDSDIAAFYADLRQRFSSIPGVRNVTFSRYALIGGGAMNNLVTTPGGTPVSMLIMPAGASFFTTMQIPILLGRDFEERDQSDSSRVATVNEAFAQANFGADNPLGRHITLGNGPRQQDLEIIGVAKNARYTGLKQDIEPTVYIPYNLGFPPVNQMVYELRTTGDPLTYVNTVREIVRQADPRLPVSNIRTQASQVDQAINQEILFARLCSAFAMLALIIACVGLYGTMAYSVARRTNEIGLRMALGAQRGSIVGMVLREVVVLTGVGLAIGLPAAYAGSRLVESFLFGMRPNDPLAMSVAVVTLVAAALLAGYAPARRAARIDPMVALRHE